MLLTKRRSCKSLARPAREENNEPRQREPEETANNGGGQEEEEAIPEENAEETEEVDGNNQAPQVSNILRVIHTTLYMHEHHKYALCVSYGSVRCCVPLRSSPDFLALFVDFQACFYILSLADCAAHSRSCKGFLGRACLGVFC